MKSLRDARKQAGRSAQWLADKMGKTYHTINNWERGANSPSKAEQLLLENLLESKIDWHKQYEPTMEDVIMDCQTCGDSINKLGFCPKCDTDAYSY